ncbi:MAG: DUF1667 domain-containing protein [Clostridia bacterium]|nr:DUF1667 domain-containing protein [Clostridia bacterium]
MEIKRLVCVECPVGCEIEVAIENGAIQSIKGNSCPRGYKYAQEEVIAPKRIVTTTVRAENGKLVPVKTSGGVLKDEIFAVMEKINAVRVKTPVLVGQTLVKEIAEGVDLVATATIG